MLFTQPIISDVVCFAAFVRVECQSNVSTNCVLYRRVTTARHRLVAVAGGWVGVLWSQAALSTLAGLYVAVDAGALQHSTCSFNNNGQCVKFHESVGCRTTSGSV